MTNSNDNVVAFPGQMTSVDTDILASLTTATSTVVSKAIQAQTQTEDFQLCNDDLRKLIHLKSVAVAKKKVSDYSYHAVDTAQMATQVGNYLQGMGYEISARIIMGASKSSSKHILEFTLENMELFGGRDNTDGDGSCGKVLIINSFNGECCLTVLAGIIRFACANGIISGDKEFFEKLKHREGQTIRERMMQLNDKVKIACEWLTETFGKRIEEMQSMELNYIEESRVLFSMNKLPEQVICEVLRRRHPDFMSDSEKTRSADSQRNVWTLFNVINEVIREKARHELNEFEHNETLMHDVIEFAKAA